MRCSFRYLSYRKIGGTILCAGTVAAGLLTTTQQLNSDTTKTNPSGHLHSSSVTFADNKISLLKTGEKLANDVRIVRKVPNLLPDGGKLNLRLYQFQNCPFCCKVRAFLDYYGFGYEVVEVNSVTKRELKFTDYKKVPIIVVKGWNGKQLNDSSFIISFLRTYFVDPDKSLEEIKSCYPIYEIDHSDEPEKENSAMTLRNDNKYFVMFNEKLTSKSDIATRREEREWRQWVDEHLVHTISPNIYRTLSESLASFRWFSINGQWDDVFASYERLFIIYVGSLMMYFVGKKLKNKHNLKPDVRESLYDACNEWMRAIGPHRQFMGGDKPNLADLAVYGVLTSFEGCSAFNDMSTHTKIGPWFQATKEAVQARQGGQEFGNI